MKFAQILDGQVHWIFEADAQPEFAPDIVIKDVTNVSPQPQEGWDYNSSFNTYLEHVEPTPIIPPPTNQELQANQLIMMDGMADLYMAILST